MRPPPMVGRNGGCGCNVPFLRRQMLLLLLLLICITTTHGDDSVNRVADLLRDIMEAMEDDVTELAAQVEPLYSTRCDDDTLRNCSKANFDHCNSKFPAPSCSASNGIFSTECENTNDGGGGGNLTGGSTCGTLYDETISTVSTFKGGTNPTDKRVIESICFARALDDEFPSWRSDRNRDAWDGLRNRYGFSLDFDVRPSSFFFASVTGSFRAYPAQPGNKQCETFDPRRRPWYQAASSGPKTIVLLLDISNAMGGNEMEHTTWAARRVIERLTDGDNVAIGLFDAETRPINEAQPSFLAATNDTKSALDAKLRNLTKGSGAADFLQAFTWATNLFSQFDRDAIDMRHATILFVTGSELEELPAGVTTEDELVGQVNGLLNSTEVSINKAIQLFTYSFGEPDDAKHHSFSQKLACSMEHGFWKGIGRDVDTDFDEELPAYVNLYSWGLSSALNVSDRQHSWVGPYDFFMGGQGLTVSLPIFSASSSDSSVPAKFVGVVGVDLLLDPILNAVSGSNSDLRVPELETDFQLTECKVAAYRRLGDLTCNVTATASNCSTAIQVEEAQCESDEHPEDLWDNIDTFRFDYKERACCRSATEQCLADNQTVALNATSQLTPSVIVVALPEPPPVLPPESYGNDGGGNGRPTRQGGDDDRETWEIVTTVIGSILGGVVSILFIVDYFRNGSLCGRSQDAGEPDDANDFHHEIAP